MKRFGAESIDCDRIVDELLHFDDALGIGGLISEDNNTDPGMRQFFDLNFPYHEILVEARAGNAQGCK
jgi:hypothetical protein